MLRGLNKKIVKVIKMGMLLIVICVNCVIIINNNGETIIKEKDACNFKYVEMIQNASSFDFK